MLGGGQFLVGNDGGVYLGNGAVGGFTQLNRGLNISQFYAGQIGGPAAVLYAQNQAKAGTETKKLGPTPDDPYGIAFSRDGKQIVFTTWDDQALGSVRTIAVARILMPHSVVRLSAGRETMPDELQALCFLAGANSIFYGEKLLTTGNPDTEADRALFDKLGLKPLNVVAHSDTVHAEIVERAA